MPDNIFLAQGEWLDLAAEQRGGRLRWGDTAGGADAADAQAARPAALQPPREGQPPLMHEVLDRSAIIKWRGNTPMLIHSDSSDVRSWYATAGCTGWTNQTIRSVHVADAGSGAMPAEPQGWRVGVWWPDDKQYYYGAVGSCDDGATGQPDKHLIHYDDGGSSDKGPSQITVMVAACRPSSVAAWVVRDVSFQRSLQMRGLTVLTSHGCRYQGVPGPVSGEPALGCPAGH